MLRLRIPPATVPSPIILPWARATKPSILIRLGGPHTALHTPPTRLITLHNGGLNRGNRFSHIRAEAVAEDSRVTEVATSQKTQ